MRRTGGQFIVRALEDAGVRHCFGVPGESFLGVLDALYDSSITMVSTRHEGGGSFARWRRDGKELFYISAERKMMAVDLTTTPTLKAGIPKALFQTRLPSAISTYNWDVSADGKRFLVATSPRDPAQSAITVVTNWPSMLTK